MSHPLKSNKTISTIGLEMPADFPSEPYEAISARLVNMKDPFPESWSQFTSGWNAVAIRFLSCIEHDRNFTLSVIRFTNAPRQPGRYIQERELFGFFVTGLSCIDSLCYSLYFIASILNKEKFTVLENKIKYIYPSTVKKKFEDSYKDEIITNELKKLIEDQNYKKWKNIRNILAHRSMPGRHFYSGGEYNGKALWIDRIEINENTTVSRLKWLKNKITTLINATDVFTKKSCSRNAFKGK